MDSTLLKGLTLLEHLAGSDAPVASANWRAP